MPKRTTLISIHLVLAALFLPLMLAMPLSGSAYLLGYKGSEVREPAFMLSAPVPEDEEQRETYFREAFAAQGLNFDFEYIRGGTSMTFRPSTRVHYAAKILDDGRTEVTRVNPSLLRRLIELHKGHGPWLMRWFAAAFGVALIGTALSGLWLAWSVRRYRKQTLIAFGIGTVVMVLCMV